MTTQADLFKKLKERGAQSQGDDKPALPKFVKFKGDGDFIQILVKEAFATVAYDPSTKSAAKGKDGNEIPQLNLTGEIMAGGKVKGDDGIERATIEGEVLRMSFANDLLWKLGAALEELGLDEVPVGAVVAAKWDGMFGNTRARNHIVKVVVPE